MINKLEIARVEKALPYGFDVLKREASKEGFSLIDRLVNEWHNNVNQFNKEGELLLAAYLDGDLAAIRGPFQRPLYCRRTAHAAFLYP